MVEERDGKVEMKHVVRLHVYRLLKRAAGIREVIETRQRDREVHVRRRKVGLQIDASGEEVEGRGVLPRVEVHEPKVVGDDPLKWVQVESPLEAGDRGYILGLPEKAHPDVVPQLRRVRRVHRCYSVLDQCDVHVRMILDDRASCQDCLGISRIVRQGVAEVVKGFEVLPHSQVEYAEGCQQLCVLRREFERLGIDVDGRLVILLKCEDLPELHERDVMALDGVGLREALDGVLVLSQVHVTEAFVVPGFPVIRRDLLGLIVDLYGRPVLPEQVKAPAHLLEVVHVVRINARSCLEKLQGLLYLTLLPLDEGLHIDRVLAHAVRFPKLLLDDLHALLEFLANI
mmetsp:Transcript_39906/g.87102  ORF Transcript_39906/g.87102 Transcript_39906/m.87102 type:complete len:343 (+) Transcript_39906:263-1291(+)